MSTFTYSAVRRSGERVSGELEAQSRAEAYQKLNRDNLQPISLAVKDGAGAKTPGAAAQPSRPERSGPLTLNRGQLIMFTEELSDLLEAGLQLEPALSIMEQRSERSSLKSIAISLRHQIREGSSFSTALRSASKSFDELYCNMVAAGELSGALPQILRRQMSYLVLIDDLQRKVMAALVYPAFIFGAGVLLLFVFMVKLVPQLTVLFSKTGQQLPLPTRILIGTSDFFAHWWWAVLLSVALIWIGFQQFTRQPEGRRWWDEVRLKLPIISGILNAKFYAQLAHTLATLVGNGVPLLTALRLVKNAVPNVYLKGLLEKVVDIVGEGGALSRAFKRVGKFPAVFVDIVSVGEQTGDLSKSLEKVGARYDKELNNRIAKMTTLIQPLVIIFIALLVGFVAYSMITGIFQAVAGLRVKR